MTELENQRRIALEVADQWYESHRTKKGSVNTNVMTSGMAVAELLRDHFPLTPESIKSEKNSQVKGLSGKLVKDILARFDETRKFTSEGGRTSRGTLVMATDLATMLTNALAPLNPTENDRCAIADSLQGYFVSKVRLDYFDKKRIEVTIDVEKPVSAIVADVIEAARSRADNPAGIVAQHIVGAKLELRFPSLEIGKDKANAADLQTNRQGDYQLGTTAFHVTVAPSAKLVDRARSNLAHGYRPVILVPQPSIQFAIGLFESEGLGNRVGVQSIESFVGTNVEEMGNFDFSDIRTGVARLIRTYNNRIEECEVDQSLRIEEPAWIHELLDISYSVTSIDFGNKTDSDN